MSIMVRLRSARRLAWLITSAVCVPYLAGTVLAAGEKAPVKVPTKATVVAFPLDIPEGKINPRVMREMDKYISDGVSSFSEYRVLDFSPQLPAVKRLTASEGDKATSVSGPFASDPRTVTKAIKLARAAYADFALLGSVDKYTYTEGSGVEMTVTVQYINAVTGKVAEYVAVSGRSTSQSGTEAALATEAIADAGKKIVKGVTGKDYAGTPAQQTAVIKKERHKATWPWAVLAVGIAFAVSRANNDSGSSSGNSGAGGPPGSPF